jgi:hypothetical protein
MITFCILVVPLPHAVRKRLFRFLSESPIVAKIAYGLKISFMSVSPSLQHFHEHSRLRPQIRRNIVCGRSPAHVSCLRRSRALQIKPGHSGHQDWDRYCRSEILVRISPCICRYQSAYLRPAFTVRNGIHT